MRRLVVVCLGVLAFFGFAVSPASAVPDPVGIVACVAETPAAVTELVDPAALLDPAGLLDPTGLPVVSCLAP
ncbi:hypothetical protein I5Q34_01680 [Streptomyces sp. AV19]|uniref:hypothetical protein n=1 Tax=Streptomyces sp. AV19 TaxID=2793068 RepID=UPI0018FE22CD|nr:hypothetical protein [Streptomyces sp. AV19]MBH1933011.1 hypothetical protein [Streptomyces sp. AV19]MDG4531724.1 hypothetical protein [Streptomyces sp. AV19]